MSVKLPMANENTSVIEVMKMATDDSDIASTMRFFSTASELPKRAFLLCALAN